MNFSDLKSGDRVITQEGHHAVIMSPSQDGRWVLVQYEQCVDAPHLDGTQDLAEIHELKQR